jgi:hypothetical protein
MVRQICAAVTNDSHQYSVNAHYRIVYNTSSEDRNEFLARSIQSHFSGFCSWTDSLVQQTTCERLKTDTINNVWKLN